MPCLFKLLSETLTQPAPADRLDADPEGFQYSPNMSFEILPHPDKPFARSNQDTDPFRRFTADMDRRGPSSSRKLREPLGIARIGFVDPTRKRLVRQARVNAHNRQTLFFKFSRQPNRKYPTRVHDALWIWRLVLNEPGNLGRISGSVPTQQHRSSGVDNADRDGFDGYI